MSGGSEEDPVTRVNVDIREYARLKEIEEQFNQLTIQKNRPVKNKEEGESSETLDAPVTQFGSGSVELIEKIVEGAVEKALAKRSTAQPDIEFPAAAAPHSSTVTETVVPQSTLKPEDSEAQAQPKVTGAKKKQQRWYYLGSADDACFN